MCRLSVVLLLTGCSAHFVTFHGDTGDDTTGAETGGSADTATDSGTTDSGGSSSTDSDTGSVDPCAPRGTGAGLHITLSWEADVDLDLHLMNSPDAFFQKPEDCNFCNPTPRWGSVASTDDDPILDVDSMTKGCETIDVQAPASGAYRVAAHYYRDTSSAGPVTATVETWADGALISTDSQVLEEHDLWQVGTILLHSGAYPFLTPTFTEGADPLSPATRTACW